MSIYSLTTASIIMHICNSEAGAKGGSPPSRKGCWGPLGCQLHAMHTEASGSVHTVGIMPTATRLALCMHGRAGLSPGIKRSGSCCQLTQAA